MLIQVFKKTEDSDVMKETDILMLLTPHPNLLTMLGICTDVPEAGITHVAPQDNGLVFPWYSGGNLVDFIKEHRTSPRARSTSMCIKSTLFAFRSSFSRDIPGRHEHEG